MNWEVICNERSSLQEYRLIDNDHCKVVIKYNPRHQSARITSGNHHRLFFLESAGSLSGKIYFRNEYGMAVGNLLHNKFQPREGTLLLDTKKYQYQLKDNPSPKLFIYENGLQKPIASCSIPINKGTVQKVFSVNTEAIDNNCYFLGFCWFLNLSVEKESVINYASAK